MPTAINTEIANCLTNLGIWSYGIGGKVKSAFQEFQEICMITMAGSQNTRTRTPRAAEPKPATDTSRRRGRPPTAKKASITKGKSGVATQDLVAYITANPGVTQPTLREVFPTVAVNVLGRMLASAIKPTKARPAPAIALSGDGYWPTSRTSQRQAA